MKESKREFWDKQHTLNDDYWLSSSSPKEVCHYHQNLETLINNNQTILDIGVGTGTMCRYLKSLNKYVICADISDVALDKLKNVANECIHVSKLDTLKPVDLAICHLVFQHCNDEDVKAIIQNVNLKENGLLSFQFASFIDGTAPNDKVKQLIKNGTHFIRSLKDMKRIIEGTNKHIVYISQPYDFKKTENLRWYTIKVASNKNNL